MKKADIEIVQLTKNQIGIEIIPTSDHTTLGDRREKVFTPHRHDHYTCFFLESGHANFNFDFQNFDIQHSSLVISRPGQVHQLGFTKDIKGWFLAFDTSIVDQNARMLIEQSLSNLVLLRLDEDEKKWVVGLIELMYAAASEKQPSNLHTEIIKSLINAFFYKAAILFQAQEDERIKAYSLRGIEITKQFRQLVKAHFLLLKKPADYASMLSITVSYLNDTLKLVTGFSSTWFIQNELFTEAQRLLFYTDKSIKEIAFELGYEDYKYFIRLFGKKIGTSPANFRKTNKPSSYDNHSAGNLP
jgi:AraC family transcriptional regulator, transcriptional activator of pobA